MKRDVYDLKGFSIVLNHVLHVSPVFRNDEQGVQFNVRMGQDVVLPMKYTDRAEAVLQRELLVKALRGEDPQDTSCKTP